MDDYGENEMGMEDPKPIGEENEESGEVGGDDEISLNDDEYDETYYEDEEIAGVDDLPLFASEKARDLDSQIKDTEKQLVVVEDEYEDNNDRLRIMKDHLKNVGQEVEYTNALIEAKRKEIETETHLKQLCSRELGRYQAECVELQKMIEDEQDRVNSIQNSIFRSNEHMDQFKLQMNWNQEELEQWAVAARQKEEDSLALQKYTRADEVKIKEANLHIERLTAELLKRKGGLEAAINETTSRQVEVDRMAEEFRQLHVERQELVKNWQDTIDSMKRRDDDINEIGEKYSNERMVIKEKEVYLDDNRERLKLQKEENREVESKGDTLARILSKRKEEYVVSQERLKEFGDELSALKGELSNMTHQVLAKRSSNNVLASNLEDQQVKLEKVRTNYSESKERMEGVKGETVSAEKDVVMAEQELKEREGESERMQANVARLKESLFKRSQELHSLRTLEASLAADISGGKSTNSNLQSKLHNLDKQSLHQQELIYNAEFQIQQMERKVSRIKGERTDEEKRALNDQIAQLEAELEGSKDKKRVMTQELKRVEAEVRAAGRREEEADKLKAEYEDALIELSLDIGAGERQKKDGLKRKEEWMVQHDLLRLDVRNLQKSLTQKTDEVFSLENKREQLILSMEERCQEINIHKDLLRSQLKSLQEESHTVTMDLKDRQKQVEKLKAKFQTLPPPPLAEGEEEGMSQAHYIIKAAQQREELQRNGDSLDQEIRGKEREIRALQTTLDHLTARNNAFRQSFKRADLSSQDAEEMRKLEEKSRMAKDLLFRKKKELQRLDTDLEEDENRLVQIKEQREKLSSQQDHLDGAKEQVRGEVGDLIAMKAKMEGRMSRAWEKLKESFGDGATESLQEKVIKTEGIRGGVNGILFTLSQLSREFPEIQEVLFQMVGECGLEIPTRPVSKPVALQETVDDEMESYTSDERNSDNIQTFDL